MIRHARLVPEFVDCMPETLEPGVIYVSMGYATAAHKCCCGCGEEVVTPLSPTDWRITYDGVAVSLWPSVGNWASRCRSHYVLRDGKVIEAPPWTDQEVASARERDRATKAAYFGSEPVGRTDDQHQRKREVASSAFVRWVRNFFT